MKKKRKARRNYKKMVMDARIIIASIQLAMPPYIVSNQKRLLSAIDKFLDESEEII